MQNSPPRYLALPQQNGVSDNVRGMEVKISSGKPVLRSKYFS